MSKQRILNIEKRKKSRQLPTFPRLSSIIGVRELDFRVRNGNGYCLSTMATGIIQLCQTRPRSGPNAGLGDAALRREERNRKQTTHGNDNMVKPHDLLVLLG